MTLGKSTQFGPVVLSLTAGPGIGMRAALASGGVVAPAQGTVGLAQLRSGPVVVSITLVMVIVRPILSSGAVRTR